MNFSKRFICFLLAAVLMYAPPKRNASFSAKHKVATVPANSIALTRGLNQLRSDLPWLAKSAMNVIISMATRIASGTMSKNCM